MVIFMKIGIDIDDTITDSYDIITASYAYCTKSSQKLFINNKLSYLDLEKKYPNFKDYTIKSFSKIMPYAKVKYQGKTYDWHVWDEDSVYKVGKYWYATYSDDE